LLIAILLALFSLPSCGGRSLNKSAARKVISELDRAHLEKEEIYIESVSQTGARDAVVEATLKAAFRFEKVGDRWVIREVRLGQRPWEKIDDILTALNAIKSDATRKSLELVADAISRYKSKIGKLPEFDDFVQLSDRLAPDFLTPLIREDAWQQPLAAYRTGNDSVRLVSPGPDGKFGTQDDIEVTRQFSP
jgi:hypothetical protein